MTPSIALLGFLSLACGRGGPPEGHTPGDGGAGGGDDTGTGGTTGGTTPSYDVGTAGIRGQASVTRVGPDWQYAGTEETYFEASDGGSLCSVQSDVAPVDVGVPPCKGCEWSFSLQTSGSAATGACAGIDASGYDGAVFSYGYAEGKYGGVLAYYYEGYGWYGTYATAAWSETNGDFVYDWPVSYFYYYGG